jgi:O-antigen ligase
MQLKLETLSQSIFVYEPHSDGAAIAGIRLVTIGIRSKLSLQTIRVWSPGVNRIVVASLVALAIVLIELMAGGTRLVLSLPSYSLLAVAGLISIFSKADRRFKPAFDAVVVTIVFFAYILWRATDSPVEYLWWTDFLMVLGCLAVYFLTAFHLTSLRERSVIIGALLILAVFEILFGIRQFAVGDEWMPFGFLRAATGRRASGSLISSIHLAGFLEAVAPFALSAALWSGWRIGLRLTLGYLTVMCYFGIAITGSRGGYLSALFSLIVFACISLYESGRTRPRHFSRTLFVTLSVLVASVLGAIAIMSQSDLIRARLAMIPTQFEKNGLDVRIYNWQATLDQFRLAPVLGTGAGTHWYYGRHFRRPELQSDPIHAHGDYLELIAEYGMIGGFGIVAFLVIHIGRGWDGVRRFVRLHARTQYAEEPLRSGELAFHIGALTTVSAYLAHSVVDFNLHIPGHALILAFVFGLLVTPSIPDEARAVRGTFALRWALPLVAVALLVFGLPKFPGEYLAEKARIALRNSQLEDAIALALGALKYQQKNPELYFALGGAHRALGLFAEEPAERAEHFDAAATAYLEGLKVFPQDEHTVIRLAETMADLGRFQEAGAFFRAALVLDPKLGRIHAYYAKHLALVGREKDAEESLAKARSLAPYDDINFILRGTYLHPDEQNK